MALHLLNSAMGLAVKTLSDVLPLTALVAVSVTVVSAFDGLSCNAGKKWWRNAGLKTDLFYVFVIPFFIPQMRIFAANIVIISFYVLRSVSAIDFAGLRFITELSLPLQALVYVVLGDFFAYWAHRAFHGRFLWPIHAIHHSAKDVDWTTSNRVHPLNTLMGVMVINISLIYIGISPKVIIVISYFDALYAYFVHSNLKFTLGPFRYLLASPVFHRWHHTSSNQAQNKNFGGTFALWDVLFGTFYMPDAILPQRYGLEASSFPTGFVGQLLHPFACLFTLGRNCFNYFRNIYFRTRKNRPAQDLR